MMGKMCIYIIVQLSAVWMNSWKLTQTCLSHFPLKTTSLILEGKSASVKCKLNLARVKTLDYFIEDTVDCKTSLISEASENKI